MPKSELLSVEFKPDISSKIKIKSIVLGICSVLLIIFGIFSYDLVLSKILKINKVKINIRKIIVTFCFSLEYVKKNKFIKKIKNNSKNAEI